MRLATLRGSCPCVAGWRPEWVATSGTSTIGVREGKGMHHRDDCLDTRPAMEFVFLFFFLYSRPEGRDAARLPGLMPSCSVPRWLGSRTLP